MAESYRNQGEEEQTRRPGKMRNMCCKCCSAVLSSSGLCQWQRFGKLITCSWAGAPVKHGWSPKKHLQINAFAWCDHYLMWNVEWGPGSGLTATSLLKDKIMYDTTECHLMTARENKDEQGRLCANLVGWLDLLRIYLEWNNKPFKAMGGLYVFCRVFVLPLCHLLTQRLKKFRTNKHRDI